MNVTYLRSFSVESQLTFWGRGHDAISWSSDNQVALVHKKGVSVYECLSTPGVQKQSPALTIFPSRIDIPAKPRPADLGNFPTGEVLKDVDKQHIFDMLRDPILRPDGYDTTIHHNYVANAAWSPKPIYLGLDMKCKCMLGVLSSNHQLSIYARNCRRMAAQGWEEPWEVIANVSEIYNDVLIEEWNDEGKKITKANVFDNYKKRLYQLAIIKFLWIPDSVDDSQQVFDGRQGLFKTYFLTFHANGDVCIWKILVSKTVIPKYAVVMLYRNSGLFDIEDTVSSVAYHIIDLDLGVGLLLVGTNTGKIISCFVKKTKKIKKKEKDANIADSGFNIEIGHTLYDADMIRVDHLLLCPISEGRRKLSIIAVKNPNILIATTVSITPHKVTAKEFSSVKIPIGPVTGIAQKSNDEFVISHENGVLSLVSYENGELQHVEDSNVSIFNIQKTLVKKKILLGESVQKVETKRRAVKKTIKDSDKRLIFKGIGLSPNQSLLCVARTIGVYYDHLEIRKPTQLVFYSLLPQQDGMFDTVRETLAANSNNMQLIADVLVPFRHALRGKSSESLNKEITRWAAPLSEKSTADLQLLLWCLRLVPRNDAVELEVANAEKMFDPNSMKRLTAIDALHERRIDVVIDEILQRRFTSLAEVVLDNRRQEEFTLDEPLNKQCLQAALKYVESKAPSGKEKMLQKTAEYLTNVPIPLCYWCKGPIEFPLTPENDQNQDFESVDPEVKTPLDNEPFNGFKWDIRRHPVKNFGVHKPEICILSLLPLQFPYRRCRNCHVPALMEPAFSQEPICPLCNSFMYPSQMVSGSEKDASKLKEEYPDVIEDVDCVETWFNSRREIEDANEDEDTEDSEEYVSDSSD